MGRKLVCFGAGEKSKYVQEILRKYSDDSVVYYVEDQEFSKIGKYLWGA